MAYPPYDFVSPQRERELRRQWRQRSKARGLVYPKLGTIGFVELDAITVPEWAWKKAVKGLARTEKTIWLRRIMARHLMRADEFEGGAPRVTWTSYRLCQICRRPLLGLEAENRFNLDRRFEGARIPCGGDCVDYEQARVAAKWQRKRKDK